MEFIIIVMIIGLIGAGVGMASWHFNRRRMGGPRGRGQMGPGGYGHHGQQQMGGRGGQQALPPHQQQGDPNAERSPHNLFVGDVVMYLGTDYIVQNKMIYSESGWSWVEYELSDSGDLAYLSVEEDDELEIALSHKISDLEVTLPLPNVIEYRGDRFRRTESGKATMTKEVGGRGPERVRYYEYQGPDGQYISIEDWDGKLEAALGEEVAPSTLSFLPGSPDMVATAQGGSDLQAGAQQQMGGRGNQQALPPRRRW